MYWLFLVLLLTGCSTEETKMQRQQADSTQPTRTALVAHEDASATHEVHEYCDTKTQEKVPEPVCVSDNECISAQWDTYHKRCTFEIVDQIGDVPCDDHNPCTYDDICNGDFCAGILDFGCAKKKGQN